MKTLFKIFIFSIIFFAWIFLIQNLVNLSKVSQPENKIEESQQIEREIIVSLKLDFGQAKIKNFENIRLEKGETVFDLLKKATQENNLEFSFKEYPDLGAFIESIDKVANNSENNKWWQYWVNNEYAKVGASLYQLKDGDLVEWKYVESKF